MLTCPAGQAEITISNGFKFKFLADMASAQLAHCNMAYAKK